MAKKTEVASDEERLKKKIEAQRGGEATSSTTRTVRGLRKRLKRTQRKRRRLALRRYHAQKQEAGADAKASG